MELLNRRKCAFNFLMDAAKIFLKVVAPICTPTNDVTVWKSPQNLKNTVLSNILLFVTLLG
jgi:hypothetical protein